MPDLDHGLRREWPPIRSDANAAGQRARKRAAKEAAGASASLEGFLHP